MLWHGLAAFLHLRYLYNFHLLPLFFQVSHVTWHCLEALRCVHCIPFFLCSHVHFELVKWLCSTCQQIFRVGSQACKEEVVYSQPLSVAFCGSYVCNWESGNASHPVQRTKFSESVCSWFFLNFQFHCWNQRRIHAKLITQNCKTLCAEWLFFIYFPKD